MTPDERQASREMTPDELVAKFEEVYPHVPGDDLFTYPRLALERERARLSHDRGANEARQRVAERALAAHGEADFVTVSVTDLLRALSVPAPTPLTLEQSLSLTPDDMAVVGRIDVPAPTLPALTWEDARDLFNTTSFIGGPDWDIDYQEFADFVNEQRALSVPAPTLPALDALALAMNDAFTYEDDNNAVPTLPFVDDAEAFWRPFAVKVREALRDAV